MKSSTLPCRDESCAILPFLHNMPDQPLIQPPITSSLPPLDDQKRLLRRNLLLLRRLLPTRPAIIPRITRQPKP